MLFNERALWFSGLAALAGATMELSWHLEFNSYLLREPIPLTLAAVAICAAAFSLTLYWAFVVVSDVVRRRGSSPSPFSALVAAAAAPVLWHTLTAATRYVDVPVGTVIPAGLILAALTGSLLAAACRRKVTMLLTLVACIATLAVVFSHNDLPPGDVRPKHLPDVVIVTVSGVGADRLGCYGYAPARTPHVDGLARNGWRPARCVAASLSAAEAHAVILTSRPFPATRDSFNEESALPIILKAAGYTTAAFVSRAELSSAKTGLGEGFDVYDDNLTPDAAYRPSPLIPLVIARRFAILKTDADPHRRSAHDVTEAAAYWVRATAGRPRFIWLNYGDAEPPYTPPRRFVRPGLKGYPLQLRLNKKWRRETSPPPALSAHINELYDGEISYVDAEIGRFLATLRRYGSPGGQVILVLGDRGQSLASAGGVDPTPLTRQLEVPFILYTTTQTSLPPQPLTSHYDVAPTLLDILHIAPPNDMIGVSVLRRHTPKGVYTTIKDERGVVVSEVWTTTAQRWVVSGEGIRLYRLAESSGVWSEVTSDGDLPFEIKTDLAGVRRCALGE